MYSLWAPQGSGSAGLPQPLAELCTQAQQHATERDRRDAMEDEEAARDPQRAVELLRLARAEARRSAERARVSSLDQLRFCIDRFPVAEQRARLATELRESSTQIPLLAHRNEINLDWARAAVARANLLEEQLTKAREELRAASGGPCPLLLLGGAERGAREQLGAEEWERFEHLCKLRELDDSCPPSEEAASAAAEALAIDSISYGVALFAPEKWAPVCSAAANGALSVMLNHAKGWTMLRKKLGRMQSRGAGNRRDMRLFGSAVGEFAAAITEIDQLAARVRGMSLVTQGYREQAWLRRWHLFMDLCKSLFEEQRLRVSQFYEACVLLSRKADNAADRIGTALAMRASRLALADPEPQ